MKDEMKKGRCHDRLHALVRCPYCKGSGDEGWVQNYHECVECGGSGKLKLQKCDLKYLAKLEKEK